MLPVTGIYGIIEGDQPRIYPPQPPVTVKGPVLRELPKKMAVSLAVITLISICTESICYGIYVVLFLACMHVLLQKRKRDQGLNKLLMAVSIAMFILSTTHVVVDLIRVVDAFISHPDSPAVNLAKVSATSYLVKSVAYYLETIIGDGFMLYRLFWVWRGDKRVTIPIFICFIASMALGATAVIFFSQTPPNDAVFSAKLQRFIASFFCLTLVTNSMCTLLIAGRIWWMGRKILNHATVKGRSTMPAATVIIESGAIYSILLILLLATYEGSSYTQYIFLDAVCPVIGIVFSMIIVRISLGLNSNQATAEAMTTFFTEPSSLATPQSRTRVQEAGGESHHLGPLAIKVTQETFRSNSITGEINRGKTLDFDNDYERNTSDEISMSA